MERISSYKYLGVLIASQIDNLSCSTHIDEISNKKKKIILVLFTISVLYLVFFCPTSAIYLTIVRPHLEYAS